MATFTIDLLTGNLYLFSGSGSTSGSTSAYPQVNLYSNLPSPASAYTGKIYVVTSTSGSFMTGRKDAGLYYSNGSSWVRLGDTPSYFNSNNFQVYDSTDTTKGIKFVTTGLTTGILRQVKFQNLNGTVAYLTDLNTKVDLSVFTGYTGATNLNLQKIENDILYISGVTSGDTIIGNYQVVSTITSNANEIIPVKIVWSSATLSGTTAYWSGGTSIWIVKGGTYEVLYSILLNNDEANETHSVGANVLVNNAIIPITSAGGVIVGPNANGNISLPSVIINLADKDKLDLATFRIGNSGNANFVSGSVFLAINKLK